MEVLAIKASIGVGLSINVYQFVLLVTSIA